MSAMQSPFVTDQVADLAMSAIKGMAMRAAALPDVASLTWGVPSFQTPEHIRRAVTAAFQDDPDAGKYTLPDGLPMLRREIAAEHYKRTGIEVCPDRNVLVTAGNMQGVKALLDTVLSPGDEVIVTDPCFASHLQQIRLAGGSPVFWPLDKDAQWAVDIGSLEGFISPKTRAILLVTPCNPTGTVFAKQDLMRVADVARQHGLLIILDDPYSQFCYDDADAYFDLASVELHCERIAYLFTFSKCHAMSGWRLGYAILPESLKQQVLKVHDATLICAPRPSQIAGLAAVTGDQSHLAQFREILSRRRELICQRLDRVPHVFSYVRPKGAYYVFPRIEVPHADAETFAIKLLTDAKVCITPGSAFGPSGEGHVRMAFCVADDEINKAFDRIEHYFGREA